jgi:glycogen operon protein
MTIPVNGFQTKPSIPMKNKRVEIRSDFSRPLLYGANIKEGGVQFSIFSRHASKVWLLLFDLPDSRIPSVEIELDPQKNRTGDIWHVWVGGLKPGQLYLWRMDSLEENKNGHCFNPQTLIIDPFARVLTGNMIWDQKNPQPAYFNRGEICGEIPKCVVYSDTFDWEGDAPLKHPLSDTVIYECHVGNLTKGNSANIRYPGTFRGVTEKIPYFKNLGITALEFLPVQEFSALQDKRLNPFTGEILTNHWGYNTLCFFAPNGKYSSSGTLGQQVDEFKNMVKELHRAGIEVYLDVVFNHTAEGGKKGPVISFKAMDNSIFYLLDPKTKEYLDYTGCGNTMNCNHPVVRNFITMCLHYWVLHMHVDGFRFDLASVLGRDERGKLLANPPLLERIEEDPILRDTKIIAEAWDAAGAYQVGEFTGRWGEWNGKFRDDVRKFWRGDPGSLGSFATRISGSSDLYGDDGRTPHHSINFVFSHDGFTLKDWTSYEKKHNWANGHNNEDGDNLNFSYNFGVEGDTDDPQIATLRSRQSKNLLATLMLSLGVPMILGGDEFLRSQKGNNNPYCQDNDISWFDWSLVEKNAEMVRFVKEVIKFRKRMPVLKKQSFYYGKVSKEGSDPDIQWLGTRLKPPRWNGNNLALAALINGSYVEDKKAEVFDLFIMFNANIGHRHFSIPKAPNGGAWKITINTQKKSPEDIFSEGNEPLLPREKKSFKLLGRSLAVFIAPGVK